MSHCYIKPDRRINPGHHKCDRWTESTTDIWVGSPTECLGQGARIRPDAPLFDPSEEPCPPPKSPIVLDLDGDGEVEADEEIYFDHEGDGFMERTNWVGKDDGILALDRNGDGVINDGTELFGNNTVLANGRKAEHGFAALAELDDNNDGVVDAQDSRWSELVVGRWTDSNGDGKKDRMETVGLDTLGIASLNTGYTTSGHVDAFGNEHRQVGSFTKTDGTTATMTDVWFDTDVTDTIYRASVIPEHGDAISALPEANGFGQVYNLRDAMALDDATDDDGNSLLKAPYYETHRTETRSLRELVEAFAATDAAGAPVADKAAREALAEKILLRWAGAEGVYGNNYWRSAGRGTQLAYTTSEKVAVVEAFMGNQGSGGTGYRHPALSTAQKVNHGYLNLLEGLYATLMLQTHLSDLTEALAVVLKEGAAADSTDINDYNMDFSGAAAILDGEDNARKSEYLRSLAAVYGQSEWMLAGMEATAPGWVYEYTYYAEYLEDAVFDGNLRGSANNFVGDCGCSNGGDGVNVFQTTDGGADRLEGRGGDDIYHLGYGTGHDRIEEWWRDSHPEGDEDVIKVAPGIAPDSVRLSRTRDDLIISLVNAEGEATDSLRIVNHYLFPDVGVHRNILIVSYYGAHLSRITSGDA